MLVLLKLLGYPTAKPALPPDGGRKGSCLDFGGGRVAETRKARIFLFPVRASAEYVTRHFFISID